MIVQNGYSHLELCVDLLLVPRPLLGDLDAHDLLVLLVQLPPLLLDHVDVVLQPLHRLPLRPEVGLLLLQEAAVPLHLLHGLAVRAPQLAGFGLGRRQLGALGRSL